MPLSNARSVSQRPLRTALSVGALVAIACSVYGPGDLNGDGSGGSASGGRANGGAGGSSNGGNGGGLGGGTELGGSGGSTPSGGSSGTGANAGIGGDGAGGQGEGGEGEAGSAGSAGSAGNGGSPPTGGTTSGGGGGSSGGGVAGGGSSSGGAPALPMELIENMEDGNPFILPIEKRDGNWYTTADKGSSVTAPTMAAVTDSPSAGSTKAFYFKGNGSGGWGALAGFDFLFVGTGEKLPYDAAHYKGITFYAKAAAATTITVRVPIVATTPNAEGSTCTVAPATPVTCEDHYSVDVPLTTSWRAVTFVWADLHQVGWGKQTWDASKLISMQFFVKTAAEYWVDDISFVK